MLTYAYALHVNTSKEDWYIGGREVLRKRLRNEASEHVEDASANISHMKAKKFMTTGYQMPCQG